MTEFIPTFVLGILGVTAGSEQQPARMLLIVRRPYAYLADRLRKAFEGREDIAVIDDRRRGERRTTSTRPVREERRGAERRTSKEEILQVVIEGDPLSMFR